MKKLLLLFLTISISANSWAMQKRKEPGSPSPETQEAKAPKTAIEPQEIASLESLPAEKLLEVFLQIINSSPTAREAAKEIRKIASLNKNFRTFIASDDVNLSLILALARRFTHGNAIEAAEILGTNAAMLWSSTTLPESVRAHINRILSDFPDEISEEDVPRVIRNLARYINSDTRISNILHNDYAMIWLLRTSIKKLISAYFAATGQQLSATEFAQRFYPEGINSELVQQWLTYADRQIAADQAIVNAFKAADINALQKLRAEGIDIFDTMPGRDANIPYILMRRIYYPPIAIAQVIPFLNYLISAGFNVNEKDYKGDTLLHHLIQNTQTGLAAFNLAGQGGGPIYINRGEQQNRLDMISRLLQAGASPNIRNNQGQTPLRLIDKASVKIGQRNQELQQYFNQIANILIEVGAER